MTNEIMESMIAQLEALLENLGGMHRTVRDVIGNMHEINRVDGVGPSEKISVTICPNTTSSKTYNISGKHNEIVKERIIRNCKTSIADQARKTLRALASLNEAEAMLKELSNNGENKDA